MSSHSQVASDDIGTKVLSELTNGIETEDIQISEFQTDKVAKIK